MKTSARLGRWGWRRGGQRSPGARWRDYSSSDERSRRRGHRHAHGQRAVSLAPGRRVAPVAPLAALGDVTLGHRGYPLKPLVRGPIRLTIKSLTKHVFQQALAVLTAGRLGKLHRQLGTYSL